MRVNDDAKNRNPQEDLPDLADLVARRVVQRRDGSLSVVTEDLATGVVWLCPLRLIPDRPLADTVAGLAWPPPGWEPP